METVFNHHITPAEWDFIGSIDREKYLSIIDEDSANYDMAELFFLRGEEDKANEYLNKLPLDMKQDLLRTITHP